MEGACSLFASFVCRVRFTLGSAATACSSFSSVPSVRSHEARQRKVPVTVLVFSTTEGCRLVQPRDFVRRRHCPDGSDCRLTLPSISFSDNSRWTVSAGPFTSLGGLPTFVLASSSLRAAHQVQGTRFRGGCDGCGAETRCNAQVSVRLRARMQLLKMGQCQCTDPFGWTDQPEPPNACSLRRQVPGGRPRHAHRIRVAEHLESAPRRPHHL